MSEAPKAEKIDFKKYRTKELYDSVAELIDYRGTLGKGFRQAILGSIGLSVLIVAALCGIGYFLIGVSEMGTLFI